MFKVFSVVAIALVGFFASVGPAPAVAIYSDGVLGDGFGTLLCGGGACVNVAPQPGPWAPPVVGGRQWVSDANTGGTVPGPVNAAGLAPGQESLQFTYSFSVLATPSILNLSIWADDTAGVSIDGAPWLIDPSPGPYPACSTGVIGCQVGTEGLISQLLGVGDHVITFDVFQAGGDGTPFGLMFEGDLTPVPEPATILLLGSALAAAGIASRRRLAQKKGQQQL